MKRVRKMNKMKKITAAFMMIILVMVCSTAVVFAQAEGGQIVIYHTNDIHGAAAWAEESSIGLDRVAALKNTTENAILVDAGDATQGLPFASLTQGEAVIDVMNAAGYDVMAVGNHEFDYGIERLLSNAARAEFPVLAANVYQSGEPLLKAEEHDGCHIIIERDGKKIGFFGLVTAHTATSTNPEMIAGVEFKDEIETAKHEIDELTAQGADAIIAIAHLGEYTNVPVDSAKLAQAMTGEYSGKLDAIIDGHSHTVENKEVNGVLIMQTGTGLANVGKITLDFGNDNELDDVGGELLAYGDVMETEPDPAVTEKIEVVTSGMMEMISEPVADNMTTLWGGTIDGVTEARVAETNLGSFAADAYRDAAERFIAHAAGMEAYQGLPVIGVENGGGIRASLPGGTVTKGDLISVFPFANTLMIKEITPEILYQTLESSVSSMTGQDAETGLLSGEPSGGFLQVSGVRFTYDPAAPAGEKVLEAALEDGTVLERTDAKTKLVLVSNNFIMNNGGSGHEALAELPLIGEIGGELETVEAYLMAQADGGMLTAYGVKGRIMPQGGYTPKDYTATIQIQNEDGCAAAEVPVTYCIDGGEEMEAMTDSEGFLKITVTDGPHGVKLGSGGKEVYINNYTGAGTVETEYRGYPVLTYIPAGMAEPSVKPQNEATRQPQAEPAAEPDAPGEPAEEEASFPWVWVVVGIAVIGCVSMAVVLYIRRKQKRN